MGARCLCFVFLSVLACLFVVSCSYQVIIFKQAEKYRRRREENQ